MRHSRSWSNFLNLLFLRFMECGFKHLVNRIFLVLKYPTHRHLYNTPNLKIPGCNAVRVSWIPTFQIAICIFGDFTILLKNIRANVKAQLKEYDTCKVLPRLSSLDTVNILCSIETTENQFLFSKTISKRQMKALTKTTDQVRHFSILAYQPRGDDLFLQ